MNYDHALFFTAASLAFGSGFRAHLSKADSLIENPAGSMLSCGWPAGHIKGCYIHPIQNGCAHDFGTKKGETVYFDNPNPQVHFTRLICCSLYNSWDTLKREGSAELGDEKRENSVSVSKIPPGHHTLESFAKVIKDLFSNYNYHGLEAMLQIKNFGPKPSTLDRDLANIFGINRV